MCIQFVFGAAVIHLCSFVFIISGVFGYSAVYSCIYFAKLRQEAVRIYVLKYIISVFN